VDELRALLEYLEGAVADGSADLLPVLGQLAAAGFEPDEEELNAALRRGVLLLATGGDPRRRQELDGRAVVSVAGDLAVPALLELRHGGRSISLVAIAAATYAGGPRVPDPPLLLAAARGISVAVVSAGTPLRSSLERRLLGAVGA
jgi:hypothetical protein